MSDIKIEYELIDDHKLTWYLVHENKEDEVITDEDMVIIANGNQVPYHKWCDITHMPNVTLEFRGEKYRVNGYSACFLGRIDTITIWLSPAKEMCHAYQ